MRVLITTLTALMVQTMLGAPVCAAVVCNCGPPTTPEEAVRQVSYVVEGVAVDKTIGLGSGFDRYAGRYAIPIERYLFRVARNWKGSARDEMLLDQGYTFCEHRFAIGHRYLMFVTLQDSPPRLFASACVRVFEGAEIPAFAAKLGPPTASFDLPDTVDVPSSPGLRRWLLTHLVASVAVYNWLTASHGTGRFFEISPYSTSRNRTAAIRTAWGGLIACILAFAASVVALACGQRPRAARWLAITGFIVALDVLLPGAVLIHTNEWLAAAALSWSDATLLTPHTSYEPH